NKRLTTNNKNADGRVDAEASPPDHEVERQAVPSARNQSYTRLPSLSTRLCRYQWTNILRKHTDLDIHAGGQAQALVQGFNGLARWLQDVDQALVRANLELLPRFAVNVRTAQYRVAFDARWQRDRTVNQRARFLGGVDNVLRCPVQHFVIEGFH